MISSISTPLSPSLCAAKNSPSGQPNATQEMVGCDCSCDRNTNSRLLASRDVEHLFGQQRAHRGMSERASVVIDCSSSPTAATIWSLMVSASVWLTWFGGPPPQQMHADGADDDRRQHEGGDGAADPDAHAVLICGFFTAIRNHISVWFTGDGISVRHGPVTALKPRTPRNLWIVCFVQANRLA